MSSPWDFLENAASHLGGVLQRCAGGATLQCRAQSSTARIDRKRLGISWQGCPLDTRSCPSLGPPLASSALLRGQNHWLAQAQDPWTTHHPLRAPFVSRTAGHRITKHPRCRGVSLRPSGRGSAASTPSGVACHCRGRYHASRPRRTALRSEPNLRPRLRARPLVHRTRPASFCR